MRRTRSRNSNGSNNDGNSNDLIPLVAPSSIQDSSDSVHQDNGIHSVTYTSKASQGQSKEKPRPRGLFIRQRLFGGGKQGNERVSTKTSPNGSNVHQNERAPTMEDGPTIIIDPPVLQLQGQAQLAQTARASNTTTIIDSDENDTSTANSEAQEQELHFINRPTLPLQAEAPSLLDPNKLREQPPPLATLPKPPSKTKLILSRPFGRMGVPHTLARHWVVEVSPAEWNDDSWNYRILVQKRTLLTTSQPVHSTSSSFTAAFTWRSLSDFIWLEEALRAEYHGGLLLPLLSVAIGTPDLKNTQYEVDASILRDWLGDVLNGLRGQGEVLLNQQHVDLIRSEAMEAFLYRNTDTLPLFKRSADNTTSNITSILDFPWKDSPMKELNEQSFVASLWAKPFSCLAMDQVCAGPTIIQSPTSTTPRLPLGMMSCSSRALGDSASLETNNSFVQYEPHDSSSLATHSELLEAERTLVAAYRRNSMSAMDKVRSLTEEEGQMGAAWKRFAISLSNLYSYEKELESSKVGEINKANGGLPYRKLSKQSVDELLRVLAQQKMDRATPGLRALENMLSAYVGDLTAVGPAVNAYSDAVTHLANLDDAPEIAAPKQPQQQQPHTSKDSWSESIRALASLNFVEMKKTVSSFSNTESTAPSSTLDNENVQSQRKAFENRVLSNERMLRDALTTMCRATPVRSARMAYLFFNIEAAQAALLNSAALLLRAKISVADPKAISKLKHRHVLEDKEDDKTERTLVKNIVNIGYSSKFTNTGELDDYNMSSEERERNMLRDKAIQLANDRLGKWDATLALGIMEAVGIDDAEVQVEETTRELRLIRRHAIGLRDSMTRCVEAVEMLRTLLLDGNSEGERSPRPLRTTRREFVNELGMAFSGAMDPRHAPSSKAASPSMSILAGVRIVTDDPTGWVFTKANGGKCREVAMAYIESRDGDLENLLDELSSLLDAYYERLENVESFVYMHCVGIQLEKHFSKVRAESLAAFEKKTDITTAINLANRKRLPLLVAELEAKLEAVEPKVTHTTVKESKETHLVSKNLKTEIGDLATRRFIRVRETALERVVQLIALWAKYEEKCTCVEIMSVGNVIEEVERTLKLIDVRADGISHIFTKTKGK